MRNWWVWGNQGACSKYISFELPELSFFFFVFMKTSSLIINLNFNCKIMQVWSMPDVTCKPRAFKKIYINYYRNISYYRNNSSQYVNFTNYSNKKKLAFLLDENLILEKFLRFTKKHLSSVWWEWRALIKWWNYN